MKKIFYIFFTAIQLLLYIGAYIFEYFTKKKMGMARHVSYLNGKLEEKMPIQMILYIAFIIVIILLLVFIFNYLKTNNKKIVLLIFSVITTLIFGVILFLGSLETLRAYYFLNILIGISGLIQVIKANIIIKYVNKKQL